ncbi:hypothetical protein FJZ36_04555 [Candidatus Poribacteria bacterium]|nr:hypothetical protein [Candidatus Poribacteria bacterium]
MNRWRAVGRLASGLLLGVLIAMPFGCSSRDEMREEDLPAAVQEANRALAAAEAALKAANIEISFENVSELDSLREVLPDPDELAKPETQDNLEVAITEFYNVFDAMEVSLDPLELMALERNVPASPAQLKDLGLSTSDQALVHLYLGYLYALDAVSRLQQAGEDLFQIAYPRDLVSGKVYEFQLLVDIQGMSPDEVIALFGPEQRQAVLDAVALLTGGKINVGGLTPDLDPTVFRRSAIYHVAQAVLLANEISPQLKNALDDLDTTVNEQLAAEILREVESWGFTLEALPAELLNIVQ